MWFKRLFMKLTVCSLRKWSHRERKKSLLLGKRWRKMSANIPDRELGGTEQALRCRIQGALGLRVTEGDSETVQEC